MSMVRIAMLALAFGAARGFAQTPDAALRAIVDEEAKAAGISARLIAAIITIESAWNPWAMHLETRFRYLMNVANHAQATHTTIETERELQKMAFGLMQLVGGTARAIGYKGPLTLLLDPEVNIHWGSRYLRQIRVHYPNNVRDQVAAYNAGSVRLDGAGRYVNQAYVDQVIAILTQNRHGGGLP